MSGRDIVLQIGSENPQKGVLQILGRYFSNDCSGLVYLAKQGLPGAERIDDIYQFIPSSELGRENPLVYQFPEMLDIRSSIDSDGLLKVSNSNRPLLVEPADHLSESDLIAMQEVELPNWY